MPAERPPKPGEFQLPEAGGVAVTITYKGASPNEISEEFNDQANTTMASGRHRSAKPG